MPQPKQPLDQLFRKFTRNNANPEEQSLFWKWVWQLNIPKQPVFSNKGQEKQTRDRMRQAILRQIDIPVAYSHQRKLTTLRSIAAFLVITIAGMAGWFALHQGKHPVKTATTVISNEGSNIRSVLLPDSTMVTLNLYSSVEWPADYNQTERRVVVRGEVYFNVHKDDKHPFIVQANNIETRALGTHFDIGAYQGESEISVSLIEGSVLVSDQKKGFPASILKPGQRLRYDKQYGQVNIDQQESANTISWMQGGLSFSGMPLAEALGRISRRFQIQIRYNGDQLKGKTVTGTFIRPGLENMLRNILFPHQLKYSVISDTIFIHR